MQRLWSLAPYTRYNTSDGYYFDVCSHSIFLGITIFINGWITDVLLIIFHGVIKVYMKRHLFVNLFHLDRIVISACHHSCDHLSTSRDRKSPPLPVRHVNQTLSGLPWVVATFTAHAPLRFKGELWRNQTTGVQFPFLLLPWGTFKARQITPSQIVIRFDGTQGNPAPCMVLQVASLPAPITGHRDPWREVTSTNWRGWQRQM